MYIHKAPFRLAEILRHIDGICPLIFLMELITTYFLGKVNKQKHHPYHHQIQKSLAFCLLLECPLELLEVDHPKLVLAQFVPETVRSLLEGVGPAVKCFFACFHQSANLSWIKAFRFINVEDHKQQVESIVKRSS